MYDKIKNKRKVILKTLTEIIIMVISVSIIIFVAKNKTIFNEKDSNNPLNNLKELTIWYNDSTFENYFNIVAKEYEKEKGIKVNVQYISDIDYLDSINKAGKKENDINCKAPDIYLIDSSELEAAYGYGLASINDDSIYNRENYSETALNAITYKGKYVAYPFTFDTSFLIYNTSYFEQAPETFESIVTYAKKFDSAENPDIKHIMYWNVTDIFHNYLFVGKYLNVGGKCGDDKTVINISSDDVKSTFSYYTELSKVFKIDMEDDFSKMTDDFLNGQIACMIITMKEFDAIKNAENPNGVKYETCEIPMLNSEINSKALSCTDTLVVNYMSEKEKLAKDFARYATYERIDLIYSNTGYLSSKHTDYMNEFYSTIQKQYDNSCSLPKLMVANDYFIQIQSILNKAWQGENVNEKLDNMNNMYITRLS